MVLTKEQKNNIINQYKLGHTIQQISESMNISKTTVHFWIKRYKQQQTLERKVGSGIKIIDLNKNMC
jgi:transposase-like protein